jgi:hypothetical protein
MRAPLLALALLLPPLLLATPSGSTRSPSLILPTSQVVAGWANASKISASYLAEANALARSGETDAGAGAGAQAWRHLTAAYELDPGSAPAAKQLLEQYLGRLHAIEDEWTTQQQQPSSPPHQALPPAAILHRLDHELDSAFAAVAHSTPELGSILLPLIGQLNSLGGPSARAVPASLHSPRRPGL